LSTKPGIRAFAKETMGQQLEVGGCALRHLLQVQLVLLVADLRLLSTRASRRSESRSVYSTGEFMKRSAARDAASTEYVRGAQGSHDVLQVVRPRSSQIGLLAHDH
jgi:hypothetical protein